MTLTTPTSLVLSGATCLLLRTPLLYIWRRGEDVLYVGKSVQGITRPLNPGHHRIAALEPDDTLELLLRPCACSMGLLSEEARLIAQLKPRLNMKFDLHHSDVVKAHPDDCPLSGAHVQREREEAAAATTAAVHRRERERAESAAKLEARWRRSLKARPQPDADGTFGVEAVAYYLAQEPAQIEKWISTGVIPSENRRVKNSTVQAIVQHGLPLDQAVAV